MSKLTHRRHALRELALEHAVVVIVLGLLGQPPHPRQAPLEIRVDQCGEDGPEAERPGGGNLEGAQSEVIRAI